MSGIRMPWAAVRCRACGHDRSEHQHLRGGTDCGRCGCRRFRWIRRG
ncbi:hypothetical protein [Amycolatopsis sp. WGS_07]